MRINGHRESGWQWVEFSRNGCPYEITLSPIPNPQPSDFQQTAITNALLNYTERSVLHLWYNLHLTWLEIAEVIDSTPHDAYIIFRKANERIREAYKQQSL